MARRHAPAGQAAAGRGGTPRPRPVHDDAVRGLSHGQRHRRARSPRTRPHAHRHAQHDRGGDAAQHGRAHDRVGEGSAIEQTRQPDAAEPAVSRRHQGARRLYGDTEMKRPRELPHAADDLAMLEDTWAEPRGAFGWLTHVDHKSIGRRYLVTAFAFFLLGGSLAALMRLQLSRPDNTLIGPDLYNQLFTTHGTTMMFLFA